SRATSSANSRRLKSPGRSARWSACSSSYRWSNENALRRKCSRTRPVESVEVAIGGIVRNQAISPCDMAEPPLHQAAAGVAPEDDLRRGEPLLRRRSARKLRAEPPTELVWVEVDDREVAEVARRQHAPVAAASRDRKLPEVAEAVRLGRDVA